jgi:hypothetical protein
MMQGRRIPSFNHSWESGQCPYKPGDYWLETDGTWYCCTPNGLEGWLKNHHVEEHPDGTISVLAGPWGSNSILVSGCSIFADAGVGKISWHGYIDRGVWKEC